MSISGTSLPNSPALVARHAALVALSAIEAGAYADAALDRAMRQHPNLDGRDRRLVTELVYGCTRQLRVLDGWIDRLATRPAREQPPAVRALLRLGLYQLIYLDRVPKSAAVHTTVELAKFAGLKGLSGFINGLLRGYLRQSAAESSNASEQQTDRPDAPLADPAEQLAQTYSYPNWIVQTWLDRLGYQEAESLCQWLDRTPTIDLRVNTLATDLETVEAALADVGVITERVPSVPTALRLAPGRGQTDLTSALPDRPDGRAWIATLPGYNEGWWTVQDASAQLVALLLDPQPGEIVIDACAAPGGKTAHIAALMGDRGQVWALDRAASRLRRIQDTVRRLGLQSVQIVAADSTDGQAELGSPLLATAPKPRKRDRLKQRLGVPTGLAAAPDQCDRLLLDVPCSGLGTLHRRADARWRQTPDTIAQLVQLQRALLDRADQWVRPGGVAVYATCTIHEPENGAIVRDFLQRHPNWAIEAPAPDSPFASFATDAGWLELWPHRWNMDGFFMVKLRKRP
ncbi:MAG: 16S rRNA (cytosine(967)-C(5))-methyltransferase [Oscillatoriales cyanobacterium]|nr:MAG: 16S rRNA (cytosine(967)-C(5))-methyltransferase [Oscillatoriales cyanobacterium]